MLIARSRFVKCFRSHILKFGRFRCWLVNITNQLFLFNDSLIDFRNFPMQTHDFSLSLYSFTIDSLPARLYLRTLSRGKVSRFVHNKSFVLHYVIVTRWLIKSFSRASNYRTLTLRVNANSLPVDVLSSHLGGTQTRLLSKWINKHSLKHRAVCFLRLMRESKSNIFFFSFRMKVSQKEKNNLEIFLSRVQGRRKTRNLRIEWKL